MHERRPVAAIARAVGHDRGDVIRRNGATRSTAVRSGLRYGVAAPIANATQAPNSVQASIATALSGLRQRCQGSSKMRRQDMARLRSRDVARANPAQSSQRPSQQARTRSHNRVKGDSRPLFVYETGHAAPVVVTGLSSARPARGRRPCSRAVAPAPCSTARGDGAEGRCVTGSPARGTLPGGPRRARPPAERAQPCSARAWKAMCSPMKLPMK